MGDPLSPIRRRFSIRLLLPLALGALVVGTFGQACRNGFVNYDDSLYVYQNRHVLAGLSLANLRWAFRTFETANWHPLTWLSLQLDAQLAPKLPAHSPGALARDEAADTLVFHIVTPQSHLGRAFGFHLTSIALHTANSLLLYVVLLALTGARGRSALVAALFALHPLRVESVAWVAERKDVLSTFFFLLSLLAYIGYVRRPSRGRYLLLMVLFALGLSAKPMLVTLPCVLLLLDYWPLQRFRWTRHLLPPSHLLLEKTPLFLMAGAACAITIVAQHAGGTVQSLETMSIPVRLENTIVSYGAYLGKVFWPVDLAIFYPHTCQYLPFIQVVAAALLLAGLTYAAVKTAGRRPYLLVGWLWYLGTLVPVIGLVQVGAQAMADRYTYIPSIGVFLALVWLAADLASEWSLSPAVSATAAAAALGPCIALTEVQIGYWHDCLQLWEHARAVTPESYVLCNNLGHAYFLEEQWDKARDYLVKALYFQPDSASSHYNLGTVADRTDRIQEAIQLYREAVKIDPNHLDARIHLGRLLVRHGHLGEGIDQLRQAVQLQPDDDRAHHILAWALAQQGRLDQAERHYREVLRLDPGSAETHCNLGRILDRQGRTAEALAEFTTALSLEPALGPAHDSLAQVLLASSQSTPATINEAIDHCRQALHADETDAEAHTTLGVAYMKLQRWSEAGQELRRAIEIDPSLTAAHNNLAVVYREQSHWEEALKELQTVLKLEPRHASAQLNWGWLLMNLEHYREAIPHFQASLTVEPHSAAAEYNLGVCYRRLGQWPEAADCFEKAVRVEPPNQTTASFFFDLGQALGKAGRSAEARRSYQQGMELLPDYPQRLNQMAWALATSSQTSQRHGFAAVLAAEQACEATEYRVGDYLATLAAAYAEVGQWDQAVATQRQALQAPGTNTPPEQMQTRLQLYLGHRPFHQVSAPPG